MTYMTPIIRDTSELCAGMINYIYIEPDMTFNQVRSLQPLHMWNSNPEDSIERQGLKSASIYIKKSRARPQYR